jgi:hypothetical protein
MKEVIEADMDYVDIIENGFLTIDGKDHEENDDQEVDVEEGFGLHVW